ncbi:hypothetical protein SAMN03097699_2805 [Flavobacteriaceae bacterium MAR_2010_188]|nr:hypothetical protein SAMN03097699_2805 [Flavobacteriaceae bacterium MAR_2010_188]
MKKNIIYLVIVLSASSIYSQSKHFFNAETIYGYEYNYFRSPKEVEREGILFTQDQILASSTYQEFLVDYDYRYKWNKNRIRVSLNPEARLFYENFDDSYWSIRLLNRYDYEISENSKFLLEGSLKRMDRDGFDGDFDVLISPFGYFTYGGSTGLELSLFSKNTTIVEGFYNFKNYDDYGTRDLQYDEYGVQLRFEQNFKKDKLNHSYGFSGYSKQRLYDTFNSLSNSQEGERKWNYLHGDVFYDLPINSKLTIEPSFEFTARIDKGADRAGYNELGPSLQFTFDNDKTLIRPKFEYLRRNYTDIEARDNLGSIGEKTQYGYANFRMVAEHDISEKWKLTADVYSKIRSSNYTDITARSFRAYRNQYAGIGIKYVM